MNDFTKEELELIAQCVESDFYHANWPRSMYEPLLDKIQAMIDNYEEIKIPKTAQYICPDCLEEWYQCECKDNA
jgi:hypothetical protein